MATSPDESAVDAVGSASAAERGGAHPRAFIKQTRHDDDHGVLDTNRSRWGRAVHPKTNLGGTGRSDGAGRWRGTMAQENRLEPGGTSGLNRRFQSDNRIFSAPRIGPEGGAAGRVAAYKSGKAGLLLGIECEPDDGRWKMGLPTGSLNVV